MRSCVPIVCLDKKTRHKTVALACACTAVRCIETIRKLYTNLKPRESIEPNGGTVETTPTHMKPPRTSAMRDDNENEDEKIPYKTCYYQTKLYRVFQTGRREICGPNKCNTVLRSSINVLRKNAEIYSSSKRSKNGHNFLARNMGVNSQNRRNV